MGKIDPAEPSKIDPSDPDAKGKQAVMDKFEELWSEYLQDGDKEAVKMKLGEFTGSSAEDPEPTEPMPDLTEKEIRKLMGIPDDEFRRSGDVRMQEGKKKEEEMKIDPAEPSKIDPSDPDAKGKQAVMDKFE